jgi:hypothetical protein
MLRNRYVIGGGIVALLLLANFIYYFILNWGLITVKVTDAPLGQVIKSIERQGWVTIYTDMPLDTKVSMWVDHVRLPEAMETLTSNLGGTDDTGKRVPGADWALGFFAGPNSTAVKQEILAFQGGNVGDDTKTYSYRTPVNILSAAFEDSDMPVSDPYLQVWPGYHAPPPPPAPDPNSTDGQQAADPPPAAPAPPSTLQDYLQAVARESNIWIMAPAAWSPNVSAPSANISVIRAVKSLVGNAHGSVQMAIVLRTQGRRQGGGGQRGGGFGGGDTGWVYLEDRMRNAINGMPPEARPAATAQLDQEVKFQHDVQLAPPEQRMQMERQHMMGRMGQNNWRRSPAKRAAMYQRAVSNRQAARGQ